MICVMYLNARYVHCMIKQRMPRQNTGVEPPEIHTVYFYDVRLISN